MNWRENTREMGRFVPLQLQSAGWEAMKGGEDTRAVVEEEWQYLVSIRSMEVRVGFLKKIDKINKCLTRLRKKRRLK